VKKFDLSESFSNLLLVSSVLLALAPFLLGDRLVLIVSSAMREGAVMFDQFGAYLASLVS
jgi:hypothetical protein